MASLNKIILIGTLTADSELKTTVEGTSLVQFTLAVKRPERTTQDSGISQPMDYLRVIAWRDLAEKIHTQFKKNALVLVEGNIQIRTYETSAGVKKWVTEIEARDARLLSDTMPVNNNSEKDPFEDIMNQTNLSETESVQAEKIKSEKKSATPKKVSLEEKAQTTKEIPFDFGDIMNDDIQYPPQFGQEIEEEEIPF